MFICCSPGVEMPLQARQGAQGKGRCPHTRKMGAQLKSAFFVSSPALFSDGSSRPHSRMSTEAWLLHLRHSQRSSYAGPTHSCHRSLCTPAPNTHGGTVTHQSWCHHLQPPLPHQGGNVAGQWQTRTAPHTYPHPVGQCAGRAFPLPQGSEHPARKAEPQMPVCGFWDAVRGGDRTWETPSR